MLHNAQQPFSYTVQCRGLENTISFEYVDQQGTVLFAMLDGLAFDSTDGTWGYSGGFETRFEVTPFGETGSKLTIGSALPIGIMATDYILSLAFNTTLDFTKPLPLDQISTQDSEYQIELSDAIPPESGGGTTTYPVIRVIPSPPVA